MLFVRRFLALLILGLSVPPPVSADHCVADVLRGRAAVEELRRSLSAPLPAVSLREAAAEIEAHAHEVVSRLSDEALEDQVQSLMNEYNSRPQGYLPGLTAEWNETNARRLITEGRAEYRAGNIVPSRLHQFRASLENYVSGYRRLIDRTGSAASFEPWRLRIVGAKLMQELEARITGGKL